MISFIINLIRKWRCKHSYNYYGFKEEIENNIAYSLRLYRCELCGKYIWIDGRRDPFR